jgi:hypothetical protein
LIEEREQMETKDGGPAFPPSIAIDTSGDMYSSADFGAHGMSLRDYFAGQALAGLAYLNHLRSDRDAERIAEEAYAYASAMLSQREKP